jgi:nucleoside-diphosphate-sugar epimerase
LAIFSSGRALGDWLYINDVVTGILTAIAASHSGVTHWDIGSGSLTTIRDLVERLHKISGHSAASLRFDPSLDRTGTPFQEVAEKLPPGFQPQWSLQRALEEHYQLIENI